MRLQRREIAQRREPSLPTDALTWPYKQYHVSERRVNAYQRGHPLTVTEYLRERNLWNKYIHEELLVLIQPRAIHEETELGCYACSCLKMPL